MTSTTEISAVGWTFYELEFHYLPLIEHMYTVYIWKTLNSWKISRSHHLNKLTQTVTVKLFNAITHQIRSTYSYIIKVRFHVDTSLNWTLVTVLLLRHKSIHALTWRKTLMPFAFLPWWLHRGELFMYVWNCPLKISCLSHAVTIYLQCFSSCWYRL